ncbi:pentatricopeptide repeat-containing protein At3g14730 [Phoenix dactylifera]|uniref:Pentatricopeptide repeat-containing protein At3g14730 n=1 Tax=Phoenix dactylifera TaxID=42345 RepID=A0A8B7BKP8_PHODC|nr:pentatricopeptide repeat-containing protein At3g14730 [Phoenix dactylifera]
MNVRPFSSLITRSPALTIIPRSPNPLGSHHRPRSDLAAYVSHLQLCALRRHLSKAREVHARLLATGLHASPFAVTALITLYSRCARPADALAVFRSATGPPNLFFWNAAIAALATNGLPADALLLFRSLRSEAALPPDEFTYPCAIKACSDLGAQTEVRKIHAELFKAAFDTEVFTSSALTRLYLKLGFVEDARRVFDELPERDVVLWNAMVNGFAQRGQFAMALEYYHRMVHEGILPSKFTVTGILSVFTSTADLKNGRKIQAFAMKVGYDSEVAVANALIDLYGKCHAVEEAAEVFESMPERDLFSWNSMISARQYSADHLETLRLFGRMRRAGVPPDPVTLAAVLPACSQMAAFSLGREIHGYMVATGMRNSEGDVFVDNALMDMYAKCGALEDARRMFDGMPERDLASWNIMIDGYAAHGRGREALRLFEGMAAPDEVTFVGVLAACSHAGLVEEGREVLRRMGAEFGVAPAAEHWACVADMLGRAGRLEEARMVAEAAGEAGAGAWRTYLAACRARGEAGRAAEAAERVVGLEPAGSGGWVLLANALGGAGRWGEVAEVRREMRRRGVRKAPGCSWVEVAGKGVHAFVTGDRNHPEAEGIYRALHGLIGRMRESREVSDAMFINGE